MCVCNKCIKIGGAVFLALGILFLLRDLGVWGFWNIQWWTALLIAVGVGHLASANCADCQAVRMGGKKK